MFREVSAVEVTGDIPVIVRYLDFLIVVQVVASGLCQSQDSV